MPAKHLLRVTEEGTYCHIFNKGIESKNIFQDAQDYSVFVGFLKEYLSAPPSKSNTKKAFTVNGKTYMGTPHQPKNYHDQVELLAYNLSPDCFHLLLRQNTKGSLQSLLRSLGTRYSMYFNKKYARKGALFEGPYKSVAVKSERLLLNLTAKFHQEDNAQYSSASEYAGQTKSDWINANTVLNFAKNQNINYKKYIQKFAKDENEKQRTKEVSLEPEQKLERIRPDFVPATIQKPVERKQIGTHRKAYEFLVTTLVFIILSGVGFQNIQTTKASIANADTSSSVLGDDTVATPIMTIQSTAIPSPSPVVMATPLATPSVLTIGKATIKINDGSPEVAIRQKPSVYSQQIGEALDGETYQVVRKETGWLAIVLKDGTIGFISPRYAFLEQTIN